MWCILSEPVGMSIIIINSRNPAPKFKFCSVFSAKNPTVNDALSGVTMLFAEAGMIFGVPQNNNSALHVSFPSVIPDNVLNGVNTEQFLRERECKTRSGSRAEWL